MMIFWATNQVVITAVVVPLPGRCQPSTQAMWIYAGANPSQADFTLGKRSPIQLYQLRQKRFSIYGTESVKQFVSVHGIHFFQLPEDEEKMKAIGISSSGRKSAYSKIIVRDILEESGVEYEMIHLARLNIKGCLGCLKCAKDNICVQKDDFQALIDKVIRADALVFGGANYYGTLNAIGHAFWERTFSLRHCENFLLAGKLGIAVGLDRNLEAREATRFIEMMMLSNKMAVIDCFTDPGHYQCFDCGYGHDCAVGNVYKQIGLCTADEAGKNRPEEYGDEARKRARAIGKILGSILKTRQRLARQ